MIDIHSHIVNEYDDGCKSLDESLDLLRAAKSEGITDIIWTPHYINNGRYQKIKEESMKVLESFKELILVQGININIHLGNELYITKDIDEIIKKAKANTLANSDYVLVEFPYAEYKKEYDEYMYNLSLEGYKIVIAHPERYEYVKKDIGFCRRWLKEGYLIQITQSSLFDSRYKKLVNKMLEKNYVHFVASDAHGSHRPVSLKDAYKEVSKRYGQELASDLFTNNPKRLLSNLDIKVIDKRNKRKPLVLR